MEYEQIARMKVGEFIAYAIKERNISYTKLEKLSGVSRTIIYKIVRGQSYDINSLIRVMRHLQIHIDFSLMSEDNNVIGAKPSQN